MRVLIIVFILLLVILQYKLWFQSGGIVHSIRLQHAVTQQTRENKKAYQRNQKLMAKIYRLKHVKGIIQSLARKEIGMVKPGEKYYQFVPDNGKMHQNNIRRRDENFTQ